MIRIVAKDDADIRRALSMALSGAGLPVLSMNRSEKSLEDIFLELTQGDAEEEPEPDEDLEETEENEEEGTDESDI